MKNQDIRTAAKAANIKLWQISDALGIADCNFSRRLRKELSEKEKKNIFAIIEEISRKENDDNANANN